MLSETDVIWDGCDRKLWSEMDVVQMCSPLSLTKYILVNAGQYDIGYILHHTQMYNSLGVNISS